MKYYLSKIADILSCEHKIIYQDEPIQTIYIDTRQITLSEHSLFIAINTTKNDGHLYLEHAYQKGIRNFIIEKAFFNHHSHTLHENTNYLIVENSVHALQKLARYHRQTFDIPVIGITGSNGKTVVKEWLYFLLQEDYIICKSPRSFNSQIGVPLSVLNLNENHQLAIFEAGISLPSEMENLQTIIQPTIGILTHFGTAHSEGFSNDDEKLAEKLKLFSDVQWAIIQRYQHSFLQKKIFPDKYIGISEQPNDKVLIQTIEKKQTHTSIHLKIQQEQFSLDIPFTDDASIKNAITCFACIYYFNRKLIEKILPKFSELPAISLRMEIKKGKFQSTLINDFYNSDIDSFEIAMNYLRQYASSSNKVLILSDFEEVKASENTYQKALQIIQQSQLFKVILIGKEWQKLKADFKNKNYAYYLTTADFIDDLLSYSTDFFEAVILIKGARTFEFEKIAQQVELKTHDTILEISIPALWNNLNYYKNLIGRDVKMMCMLKASGYGSGAVEMAFALQKFGVDYIGVAYTDEGVELKQANIQVPIMVMLPERKSFNDIIQYQLEPEIYSLDVLQAFVQHLEKQGIQKYPVHIKLDTGMHRLGFLPDEVTTLVQIIQNTTAITVRSVFSHLAASESDEHREYTLQQIRTFKELSGFIEHRLQYPVIKHICNSAAISRYPEAHFDMVRIGIGMYGITDNQEEERFLQNVLSLKTRVAQIKHLSQGDSVGYSRKYILNRDGKIAVIPIGYADGLSRKLSNGNFAVKVQGIPAPIIGNICMDLTMIDVTDIDVMENDEVIIFDSVRDIQDIANRLSTIPYEVLTSISQRVKRVYVYE